MACTMTVNTKSGREDDRPRVNFGPREWVAYGLQLAAIISVAAVAIYQLSEVRHDAKDNETRISVNNDRLTRMESTTFDSADGAKMASSIESRLTQAAITANRTAVAVENLGKQMAILGDRMERMEDKP